MGAVPTGSGEIELSEHELRAIAGYAADCAAEGRGGHGPWSRRVGRERGFGHWRLRGDPLVGAELVNEARLRLAWGVQHGDRLPDLRALPERLRCDGRGADDGFARDGRKLVVDPLRQAADLAGAQAGEAPLCGTSPPGL
jgi:hypothetical protein